MPERTRESQELETDRVGFRLGTEKKTGDIGDYGTVQAKRLRVLNMDFKCPLMGIMYIGQLQLLTAWKDIIQAKRDTILTQYPLVIDFKCEKNTLVFRTYIIEKKEIYIPTPKKISDQ